MRKKILKTAYVVLFLLAFSIPGILTLFSKKETIGNENSASMDDVSYLSFSDKFDDYFSKNFGMRKELINLNNTVKYSLLNESGENSVIAGKDGWLFYESALHDYTGENVLTETDINKITRILQMVQLYVNDSNKDLVVCVAPNKMEIYGEYMPYYYIENTEPGNYEHLMSALSETSVNYVDLKGMLRKKAETSDIQLYHKLDSHWNNLGAASAYEMIMKSTDFDYTEFSKMNYTLSKSFKGDLYSMIFPKGKEKDEQVYFDCDEDFEYETNFRSPEDQYIVTSNSVKNGSCALFRDSFGNALYWFFAEDFAKTDVSRALPYDFTSVSDDDLMVMEIVERNIVNILKYPPIIIAPETKKTDDYKLCSEFTCNLIDMGDNFLINISSEEISRDCTDIIVMVNGKEYMAYPVQEGGKTLLYVKKDIIKDNNTFELYVK